MATSKTGYLLHPYSCVAYTQYQPFISHILLQISDVFRPVTKFTSRHGWVVGVTDFAPFVGDREKLIRGVMTVSFAPERVVKRQQQQQQQTMFLIQQLYLLQNVLPHFGEAGSCLLPTPQHQAVLIVPGADSIQGLSHGLQEEAHYSLLQMTDALSNL